MNNSIIEKIKILRLQTNVSFIECKEALIQTNGNIENAIILLRTKGILKAKNKNLRKTSAGLISVLTDNKEKKSVILEINCETDFVSKTKEFLEYVEKLTKFILYELDCKKENISQDEIYLNKTLNEERLNFISKIGENININRVKLFHEKNKFFFGYVHGGDIKTGKIGTILTIEENNKNCNEILKDIAMQIIATKPMYLKKENIPEEILLNEQKIYENTIKEKYPEKSKEILMKIVDKQITDFINENTLLEQFFIKNQSIKIKEIIKNNINLVNFTRFEVGEIN